jgi:hypothetical protein
MAISQPTASAQFLASTQFQRGLPINPGNPVFVLDAMLVFTAAGFTSAAAGDISLLRLPPGPIRIRLDLSYLTCPAGTSTSDLDIGLAAYTKADGTTQALQGSLLADSLDVGGGALSQVLPGNPAAGSIVVNSTDGVTVVCSFDTANSPAAGTLLLKLVYQRD